MLERHYTFESFEAQEDDGTVFQRPHTFPGSRHLRTICANDRLPFGALARSNGCDKFGCDGNLVKRRYSHVHDYPRHDLAGEGGCSTREFRAHVVVVMESGDGFGKKVGLPDRTHALAGDLSTLRKNKME
jgi:hypothetical protein